MKPGEIVPVEIPVWPVSMLWHKGEQLQIIIQGYGMSWMDNLFPDRPFMFKYLLRNKGDHIIHTGGKYDS